MNPGELENVNCDPWGLSYFTNSSKEIKIWDNENEIEANTEQTQREAWSKAWSSLLQTPLLH